MLSLYISLLVLSVGCAHVSRTQEAERLHAQGNYAESVRLLSKAEEAAAAYVSSRQVRVCLYVRACFFFFMYMWRPYAPSYYGESQYRICMCTNVCVHMRMHVCAWSARTHQVDMVNLSLAHMCAHTHANTCKHHMHQVSKSSKSRPVGMMPNAECFRCGDFVFANLDQPGEECLCMYVCMHV
jgi:hypothetical protein